MKNQFLVLLLLVLGTASHVLADNHDIVRLSKRDSGTQTTLGDSTNPSISGDGKILIFSSTASNLVSDDNDNFTDIFIVNRNTPTPVPVRLSRDFNGGDTNGDNDQPNVSSDGTNVVFRSKSTDLLSGLSTQGTPQVFIYNLSATPTARPTPLATVGPYALISANSSGTVANGASSSPKVSNGGTFVTFVSNATNLDASCTSGSQVYLFNATSASNPVSCISVSSGNVAGNDESSHPAIDKNGSYVVFESKATNLTSTNTAGKSNIYLYTRSGPTITLVSSDSGNGAANGYSTNPTINADGTYIAFETTATDIVSGCPASATSSNGHAIILYKIADQSKTCASIRSDGTNCNGNSFKPALSGDGNSMAYLSDCIDLVAAEAKTTPGTGVYDVYKFVRGTPTITRENSTVPQRQVTPGADNPVINSTGSVVAFDTDAGLRIDDTNDLSDIYLTDTSCTTDTDGDSTVDCSDTCYLDATKTTPGVCGCGTSEDDTDSDGTLDCNDGCPTDPAKIAKGDCGCGNPDTDSDSNSVSDCLEPINSTTPIEAQIVKDFGRRRIIVKFYHLYTGRNYTFTAQLFKGSRLKETRSTKSSSTYFSKLAFGTYYVRYRMRTGIGTTTKYSPKQKVKFFR